MNYELLMRRCVAIGNSVLGHTYPNPNVGALIYKDGKIISEGYTGRPGQNHAEINAIENINDKSLVLSEFYSLYRFFQKSMYFD